MLANKADKSEIGLICIFFSMQIDVNFIFTEKLKDEISASARFSSPRILVSSKLKTSYISATF